MISCWRAFLGISSSLSSALSCFSAAKISNSTPQVCLFLFPPHPAWSQIAQCKSPLQFWIDHSFLLHPKSKLWLTKMWTTWGFSQLLGPPQEWFVIAGIDTKQPFWFEFANIIKWLNKRATSGYWQINHFLCFLAEG